MYSMLSMMELGDVVILHFSSQTILSFICKTGNENIFLRFPLSVLP